MRSARNSSSAPTRWIEPPWKAILSNKGILPLLWEMFPNHPNLLPAYFEDDPNAARLGSSFVRKPLYSREGANVALVSAGATLVEQEGPYGAEGFIRQALGAAAEFCRSVSGARKLAGRPRALRPVDPRGRESDHRQYVAVPAARDFVSNARNGLDVGRNADTISARRKRRPGARARRRRRARPALHSRNKVRAGPETA